MCFFKSLSKTFMTVDVRKNKIPHASSRHRKVPLWNCMQLDTGFAWWLNANVHEGTYVPPHVRVSPWRQMWIKECSYPRFCGGGRGLTCIALWSRHHFCGLTPPFSANHSGRCGQSHGSILGSQLVACTSNPNNNNQYNDCSVCWPCEIPVTFRYCNQIEAGVHLQSTPSMKTDRSESHWGSICKECVARWGNFPVKKTSTGSVLWWFTGLDCTRPVRSSLLHAIKNQTNR